MPQGYNSESYLSGARAEQARKLVQSCIDDTRQNYARLDRDKQDWQDLLFYRGGVDNHWTVWDKSTNSWVPRPYDGDSGAALPSWVPRASTNIFATKIDGIVSILDQSAPAFEWGPQTNDDEDVAAAEVIDDAMPALFEEAEYATLRRQIHKFITLIDKVFVHVYYDNDERYGTATLQMMRCPECGAMTLPLDEETGDPVDCPECGKPAEELEPAVDETFSPIGPKQPRGKICLRVIPSFEGSLPRSARIADERMVPWILLHTRYSKEEAVKCWPKAKALIENESATRSTGGTGMQRQYADAMARLTAPTASRESGGAVDPVGPVVYTLQHDPTPEFPEGLHAVMIGEQLVEAGPLPITDDEGRPQKSILIRTYAHAPGSPYNKPPADDMVPLQYWRNLIESLLALTLLHHASPRTFIPASVILEDEITGQPNQQIRYRSMIPGEKPVTESGHNPPEGLYKYLEILDQKFEELSKLNAVLMGNRPQGDPTLGEVQILQERGMAAFKTPLDTLVEFEKRLSRMLLWCARQSAWAPRFRKIRGENGQWEVEQFSFTEIGGRVDVFCEPATAWPRSSLMDNLKLKEAVGMGVVIPQTDPELAGKILTKLDLSELKPSVDADRKQIARQLDRWKKAATPMEIMQDPVVVGPHLGVQSLQMHWLLKSAFIKSEECEQLAVANPPVYQAMLMHVQQVQMLIQMMMTPAPQPGEGGEAGGEGEEEEPKPAQAGSQGDMLGEMMAQGLLMPADAAQQQQQAAMPSIDDIIQANLLKPVMPEPEAPAEGAAPQPM
jgi:hypothetical protein